MVTGCRRNHRPAQRKNYYADSRHGGGPPKLEKKKGKKGRAKELEMLDQGNLQAKKIKGDRRKDEFTN